MSRITEVKNSNNLEIKPVKFSCDTPMIGIPKPLFSTAFFYLLIGKPGSGKTTMLLNLITNKNMYKKKFNKIYLWSPSLSTLEKNPLLSLPEDQRQNELTEENLEGAIESVKDTGNKCLFIFDDCQNSMKDKWVETLLKRLIMNRRHIPGAKGFISIIITSQIYNAVPLSLRKCADMIFFWQSRNSAELKSLCEEFLSSIPKEELKRIFEYVFKDKHDCLMIVCNACLDGMLWKNFNKLIF